jgi:hypothetical protein
MPPGDVTSKFPKITCIKPILIFWLQKNGKRTSNLITGIVNILCDHIGAKGTRNPG